MMIRDPRTLLEQLAMQKARGGRMGGPPMNPMAPTQPPMPQMMGQPSPNGAASPESQYNQPLFQRPELWQAIMQTGLGMMAGSSTPGATFASTLGQSAAGLGIPTYQQGRRRAAMSDAMSGVPGAMQNLAGIDPGAALQLGQFQLENRDDGLMAVGNAVFNKNTGRWSVPPDTPDADWPTGTEPYGRALGYTDPNTVPPGDWEAIIAAQHEEELETQRAGVPDVQMTMGDREYERVIDDAAGSDKVLSDLALMETLLKDGMATGGLTEMTMGLRQVLLPLFGMDTQELGDQEVFNAIASRMQLAQRSNMPGQLSDNDILFLRGMSMDIGKTRDGNLLLLEVMRRVAQRKGALADEADRYVNETDGTRGLRRHLSNWGQQADIFADLSGPGRRY